MHSLRLLGWGLVVAAFLAASLETAAQSMTQTWGMMPARDVFAFMAPDLFDAFRDCVDEYLAPAVWDYVVFPLMILPAWLLLVVPGAALVWLGQPAPDPDGIDSFPLASYEEIVAAAEEADKDDIGIPSKYRDLDEYDPSRLPVGDMAEGAPPDPELDPLYLEQADMVPPAAHIPSNAPPSNNGGSEGGSGGGLSRPF